MGVANNQYPLGTVAFYGPTDKLATKLVASVFPTKQKDPAAVQRWNSTNGDVREDPSIHSLLTAFLKKHNVAHAEVTEEIIGCPHEEGVDYPAGAPCPHCPFWADRPRAISPHILLTPTPKAIGRNDPCYCGSGRKFKKCCATAS